MWKNERIKRAIISVTDKRGLDLLASKLCEYKVEIISTSGTGKYLREVGVNYTELSQFTGFCECFEGRVKTLHPKIHAGILFKRNNEEHLIEMEKLQFKAIDLVVVNLYDFKGALVKRGTSDFSEEILEAIDIGGPTLLRAAAKNFPYVVVLPSPDFYNLFIKEMDENNGCISFETRLFLAKETFKLTFKYDRLIQIYFENVLDRIKNNNVQEKETFSKSRSFPESIDIFYTMKENLRYGENPHQSAALYAIENYKLPSIASCEIVSGEKALSYNNILDSASALDIVLEFEEPAISIIKHNSPCGVAVANKLDLAFAKALASDPVSSYGGIIGSNTTIDTITAELITAENNFFEVIVAPSYEEEAKKILIEKRRWGRKLRLLAYGTGDKRLEKNNGIHFMDNLEIRSFRGGVLVQDIDTDSEIDFSDMEVICGDLTEEVLRDVKFAWKVVKFVKSNGIVLAKDGQTVGIGAGQQNRIDALRIAISKAGERAKSAVLASDGFFPFKDSIELASEHEIKTIIAPKGSIRDREIIDCARNLGITLIFTTRRHFRH